jgi:dGTPase
MKNMKMKWSSLLSTQRLGEPIRFEGSHLEEYDRNEFETDYLRILSCASFRRLQDKTQVFPLDKSDFVRTRLTHSYETSAIAAKLGIMIKSKLSEEFLDDEDKDAIEDIPEILASVGLIHDIGNPPFGHFGEEVIRKWFDTNLGKFTFRREGEDGEEEFVVDVLKKNNKELHKDFYLFDGNAQALRVMSKLHFHDSDYGLNLTAPILNIVMKYPTFSNQVDKEGGDVSRKKMGCFFAETETYKNIVEITGAKDCRHPLTFILEVADDIAYKTADVEDGLKKGLYSLDELIYFAFNKLAAYKRDGENVYYVEKLFEKLIKLKNSSPSNLKKEIADKDLYAMQNWIPVVREWLMYVAAHRFNNEEYASIMNGTYTEDLFHETLHCKSVEILGEFMKKFIHPNREILKLELAANTIMSGLFERFVPAVLYHDEKYLSKNYLEMSSYKKLYELLSDNYEKSYRNELKRFEESNDDPEAVIQYDIYLRLLLVVDYISGMTDSFAKSLYQELTGM